MKFRRERIERLIVWALLVLAAVFLLARFALLEADFPAHLTASDAPLTDEGWYSSAAIRNYLTGTWHLPEDVNEAVIQPTFHLIQALNFQLLGMSLTTSRLPAVGMSIALVVVSCALLLLRAGRHAALLAGLLLSVNFYVFAYSRVALVELPLLFFVTASALLLFSRSSRLSWRHGLGAGLLLAAGCLTKPTAAFSLPALVALASIRSKQTQRWAILSAFVAGAVLPLVLVYTVAFTSYTDDLGAYGGGLSVWLQPSINTPVESALRTFAEIFLTDPPLMVATLLSILLLLSAPRLLLRNQLHGFLLTAFGTYLIILIGVQNHPPRYFLPAIILAVAIVAAVASQMFQQRKRLIASVLLVLIGSSVLFNGYRSGRYLVNAETTYVRACRALAQDVLRSGSEALLMGNSTTQMSIVTGIPGISGGTESTDPAKLRDRYLPTHYVSIGAVSPEFLRSTRAEGQSLAPIATYDVFAGEAKKVIHLYRFIEQASEDHASPATTY